MQIQDLGFIEFLLTRFCDAHVFGDDEQEALQFARDIVRTLRAANHLARDFQASDLIGLIQHKSQLPERPQSIVRLPSGDDRQYDRFAILPGGLSLQSAIAAANEVIRKANQEDHDSESSGCADGDDVESNVRRGMEALGFVFLPVTDTINWDEHVATAEAVNA